MAKTISSKEFRSLYNEVLNRGGTFPFRVTGISMYPALKAGDTILVRQCSTDELNLNDIVVFHRNPYQLVAHRIVGLSEACGKKYLNMRGDACWHDEVVPFENIIGKLVAFRRHGKWMFAPKPASRFGSYILSSLLKILVRADQLYKKLRISQKCH